MVLAIHRSAPAAGFQPNIASNPNAPNSALYPLFNPVLLPYDLTRGGTLFPFVGHTDVKELSMYVAGHHHHAKLDASTSGFAATFTTVLPPPARRSRGWELPTTSRRPTPFFAFLMRALWKRPFNENLVLSSVGCSSPVLNPLARLRLEHVDAIGSRLSQ